MSAMQPAVSISEAIGPPCHWPVPAPRSNSGLKGMRKVKETHLGRYLSTEPLTARASTLLGDSLSFDLATWTGNGSPLTLSVDLGSDGTVDQTEVLADQN